MEITLNKKNNTEGVIKITLTTVDYQPLVEEKVKEYAKKASIKGFRSGKVPTGVIKRMYGKSLMVDEINNLLSRNLTDYIKNNNLKILGEPLPNHEKASKIDWENQNDFEFEYAIGMVSDFTYDFSSKVKVKSYPIEIDSKMVDTTINDLKKRFGKVTYPETSEAGDILAGDLTNENPDFKLDQVRIELEKIDKKAQAKFIGAKKDDAISFEINKIFSDEESLAELLSISVADAKKEKGTYTLKVNTISRVEPAELNTELFDRVFGKDLAKDEAEFTAKVKETIGENYNRESAHFLEHSIEDYYVENTKIELPEGFLKNWLKNTGGAEITDAVLEKEFGAYVRSVKWDLVKNKIAEDHNIKVETEDVRTKAKEMILSQFGGAGFAAQLGDKMDGIVDNYLSNENGQNFTKLYTQLRSEKIISLLKETITLVEKKVSVDEFKKIIEEHKH